VRKDRSCGVYAATRGVLPQIPRKSQANRRATTQRMLRPCHGAHISETAHVLSITPARATSTYEPHHAARNQRLNGLRYAVTRCVCEAQRMLNHVNAAQRRW